MKKLSKKEQIFRTAARLFKEYGYQATSMRQLAKEVELEASSLYSHISSKQELLAQICMSQAQKFEKRLNEILKEYTDTFDILREVSYFHIETAIEDPISVTVFSDEWRHLDEVTLQEFRKYRKDYESKILHIIAKGIHEGEIVEGHSFVLFQTFLSSFKWIYQWNKPGREIDKEVFKKDITTFMLNGLRKD